MSIILQQDSPKKPVFPKIIFGLFVMFIIVSAVVYGYWRVILAPRCDLPIPFSIGQIDPHFKLTADQVKNAAIDGISRWNGTSGRELFVYREGSDLEINLVYDYRQQELDQLNFAIAETNSNSNNLTDFNSKINYLISQYEKDLSSYKSRLQVYHQEVADWNIKGGAPAGIYQNLNAEASSLDKEKSTLDARRDKINGYIALYDKQSTQYNNNLDKLKETIAQNENKLETQGLYYSAENKIDIFTYSTMEELRLVLMHELAHATGAEHTNEVDSLMYPVLNRNLLADPKPQIVDINLVVNQCNLHGSQIGDTIDSILSKF